MSDQDSDNDKLFDEENADEEDEDLWDEQYN